MKLIGIIGKLILERVEDEEVEFEDVPSDEELP